MQQGRKASLICSPWKKNNANEAYFYMSGFFVTLKLCGTDTGFREKKKRGQ